MKLTTAQDFQRVVKGKATSLGLDGFWFSPCFSWKNSQQTCENVFVEWEVNNGKIKQNKNAKYFYLKLL